MCFVFNEIIMLSLIFLTIIVSGNVNCSYDIQTANKNFIYNRYVYDSIIEVIVNGTTTQILDFDENSDLAMYPTRVHVSTNDNYDLNHPLFVTAAQQKSVSSWELPLVVSTRSAVLQFHDMARTLCPHDAGPNITAQLQPTLTLATSSPTNIPVKIKLRRVEDFFILVNKNVSLNVTPSTPKYYYFSFDLPPWHGVGLHHMIRINYTIPKNVLLEIESDDDVCAVISIQNNSCPVFDNEKDMLYQGYHFTMTNKGGITITQSMFPRGFYVVFIVKESDAECTGIMDSDPNALRSSKRTKSFRFRAVAAIPNTDYVTAAMIILALLILVAMLGPLGTACSWRARQELVVIQETPGPSTSLTYHSSTENPLDIDEDSNKDSEPDINNSLPMPLTVAGFSRALPEVQWRRSNRYFWNALTVAVVYALPVVQLLITYQRMIFQTGDQDLCYYNFLCAHPLGILADFNHVFSNIGYVILGAVFMLQVKCRRLKYDNDQQLGIPQHRGLLYSMGLALIMEGVLSACYHLCPNKMNFQFDSSFMYVIAVLCIVKLYQGRHADINASAHTTFMLLALLMAIGCFGMLCPSVYFWIIFTLLHFGACFFLTLKIYYAGRFKMEWAIVPKAWIGLKQYGCAAFNPKYRIRAVLLAIANLANWIIAGYGLFEHNKDFARHLLAILLGNATLYTLGYVVLKLVHREKISVATWVWLVLAHITWAIATVLFLDAKTKWSQTPAHSRTHNGRCMAFAVLDSHDLWHFASAAAIFFSFNALLILDDPLANTPRHIIPAF